MINPYAQSFLIATRMERRPENRVQPYQRNRPSALRRFFARTKNVAAK